MVVAVSANAETLDEVLRMTREHPAVRAAKAEAGAARSDVTVAEAARKLQVSAGVGSAGYSAAMETDSQWAAPYVSVRKMLYDHGRTDAEVAGRTAAFAAKEQAVRVQREAINKTLVQLYITAINQHDTGKVLEEQEAALQSLLKRVNTIVSVDPGRASEAIQVESRLAAVRASRDIRATGEREALQQISQILDHPVTSVTELDDLESRRLLPASLTQARDALESHPEIEIARFGREESEAALRLASRWRKPTWAVDLRVDSPVETSTGDTKWFQGVTLQLSSGVSLFDGGAGNAKAEGSSQRVQAAEENIEVVRRTLRQELERLWAAMPLRRRQLEAQREVVASAERLREAGEEQFFAGRRPLIDLMSFDSEYFNAQLAYVEQQTQYLGSQWLMVASLGKLSEMADIRRQATEFAPGRSEPSLQLTATAARSTAAPVATNKDELNELRNWGSDMAAVPAAAMEQPVQNATPAASTAEADLRDWPLAR